MARGVKGSGTPRKPKKSIDERIIEVDKTIEAYKRAIAEKQALKKELLKEKENAERDELFKVVSESGMTPSELLALAKSAKESK